MGWWKRFKGTPQPADDSAVKLALAAMERQQSHFFAAMAEKDAQIRMVLEEKFFHPLPVAPELRAKSTGAIDPQDMTDVVQYPTKGDAEAVAEADKRLEQSRRELEQRLATELSEIVAEQSGEKTSTTEPIEMLERAMPALNREERAERARRAIVEGMAP